MPRSSLLKLKIKTVEQTSPSGGERIKHSQPQEQIAHVLAADFYAVLMIEHVGALQFSQGLGADQDGQRAGQPQSKLRTRQRVGVRPSGGQVASCLSKIRVVQRAKPRFVFRLQQVLRRQPSLAQLWFRQITTIAAQVGWQVTQNVHQL